MLQLSAWPSLRGSRYERGLCHRSARLAEFDTRAGDGIPLRIKVQVENLTRTMTVPESTQGRLSTSAASNVILLDYIRSLYDNGAVGEFD